MALTTVQSGMMDSIAQYNSFKNRIINGAMVIDQRNNGASVTNTTSYLFGTDRLKLGFTSSSAYSVGASEQFIFNQPIEGLNCADLAWGTASAATVTLSFWVRSSLTGTFGGIVCNSAGNRTYPFTYTISAANTWEQKSVTIAGDTTGTWLTTNGVGMFVQLSLGAGATLSTTAGAWAAGYYASATGATSVVGTSGATFYITGVQLEKGSTATAFDYRPYGTELSLCQRYYQTYTNPPLKGVFAGTTTVSRAGMPIPNMRVAPTTTIGGSYNFFDGTTVLSGITTAAAIYATVNAVEVDFGVGTTGSGVTGRPAIGYVGSGFTSVINANAEL